MKNGRLAVMLGLLLFVFLTIIYASMANPTKPEPKWSKTNQLSQPTQEEKIPTTPTSQPSLSQTNVFVITDEGISPKVITIKPGQSFIFANKTKSKQTVNVEGDLWGPITLQPSENSSLTMQSVGSYSLYLNSYTNNPSFQVKLIIEE